MVRECEGVREGEPGDPKGLPVSSYTHLHPQSFLPLTLKTRKRSQSSHEVL